MSLSPGLHTAQFGDPLGFDSIRFELKVSIP